MRPIQIMRLLNASGGGGGSDPFFANVSSLLHFDGADLSTVFTDQKGKTWTRSGTDSISTTQSKFGGASLRDNASLSDYVQSQSSADYSFGTGDFCVEYWLYQDPNALGGTRIHLDQRPLANGAYVTIYQVQNGVLADLFFLVNGANLITASQSLVVNTWQHIAWARVGGTSRMFIDGVLKGSAADATNYAGTVNRLGQTSASNAVNNSLGGWIDDLRITKGIGRYTTAFIPPSAPFPNS